MTMTTDSLFTTIQSTYRTVLGAGKALADSLQGNPSIQPFDGQINYLLEDLEEMGESLEKSMWSPIQSHLANEEAGYVAGQLSYVERDGMQCFLQPYHVEQTKLYCFTLHGRLENLQQQCDKYLNNPGRGKLTYEYRPLTNLVFLTCQSLGSLESIKPPDSKQGFFHEANENVFWILVGAGKQRDGKFVIRKVLLFPVYVILNNSPALVSGREVYGWPKEWGWFQPDNYDGDEDPQTFSLDVFGWKTFGSNSRGERQPLFQIDQQESQEQGETLHSVADMLKVLGDIVLPYLRSDAEFRPSGRGVLSFINYLLHAELEVPAVFLKQFRDSTHGRQACYQAIVESPLNVTKLYGAHLVTHQYTMTIQDLASHPLVSDFGFDGNEIPVLSTLWCHFDFNVASSRSDSVVQLT